MNTVLIRVEKKFYTFFYKVTFIHGISQNINYRTNSKLRCKNWKFQVIQDIWYKNTNLSGNMLIKSDRSLVKFNCTFDSFLPHTIH